MQEESNYYNDWYQKWRELNENNCKELVIYQRWPYQEEIEREQIRQSRIKAYITDMKPVNWDIVDEVGFVERDIREALKPSCFGSGSIIISGSPVIQVKEEYPEDSNHYFISLCPWDCDSLVDVD